MIKQLHLKLAQQQRITQSLFQQFIKIFKKCKQLSKKLSKQIPNQTLYNTMQRTTQMKIKVLDMAGLVTLKNNIVKVTSELFDQERQFTYLNQKKQNYQKDKKIKDKNQIHPKIRQFSQTTKVNHRIKTQQSLRSSHSSQIRQSRNLQIPIYKQKADTAQGTMDRISKYIASLKKNIKTNVESAGQKWKVKDYLNTQPTYLKAKTQLQRYMMRQQQLQRVINKAVINQIKNYFKNNKNVKQDQEYYYVTIDKNQLLQKQKQQKNKQQIKQKDGPNFYKNKNKDISPSKNNQQQNNVLKLLQNTKKVRDQQRKKIEELAEQDFNSMKTQLIQKNQNFAGLFSKMSQIVQKGSQRLNNIREKRRQVFQQDDDIWDQL